MSYNQGNYTTNAGDRGETNTSKGKRRYFMINSQALGVLRPGVFFAASAADDCSVDDCESIESDDVECDCQESDDAGMG